MLCQSHLNKKNEILKHICFIIYYITYNELTYDINIKIVILNKI